MPGTINKYTLMHKDRAVVELSLDSITGVIVSLGRVYEPLHVPVGIPIKKGMIDRGALNAWWKGRAIPASRMGIRDVLQELRLSDTQLLPEKCLGLSLSDRYWICPADRKFSWREVNFFENTFSDDVGNIIFGKGTGNEQINLMSPDNTSDGWLKKKWVIRDGKRCLVKSGSGVFCQEPYNEVLAGRICERLGVPYVPYSLWQEPGDKDERPYSVCENFLTPDTELITAWYVMQAFKKPNHISWYRHYMDCCERLGIPGIKEAVDRMLVLDYLIMNEDRHLNNFGVIRNADSLEYQGAAPIYDSGTSLWFDTPGRLIYAGRETGSKPFKSSHTEQIKLVTDFSWVSFAALAGIEEEFREIVRGSAYIDEARCDALCEGLKERCRKLESIAVSAGKQAYVDSTEFDVKENIAYSGEK